MDHIDTRFIENFNETLQQNGITIACAESMTGGLLASTICSANGALSVLKGSIVAYDSELKIHVLQVPSATIDAYTAESSQVTDGMCKGLQQLYPYAKLYIAMTGLAEGMTESEPEEGQIYVTIWYNEKIFRYATVLPEPIENDRRNAYRIQAVKFIMDKILYIVTRPPVAGIVAPEI
ncbi:MAG TPA: nicotinamide-nucleotide amidohydrolase family protein [Sphingobacterium sp.]|nr:nicotinamide-nucleotide amidohydrolase family protein [Sphingobacterium sp.]